MKRITHCLIIMVGFMFIAGSAVWSEEASSTPLQAAPKYAALFKNGVGLVISEIDGINQPGTYQITPLPSATFGSLWFSWEDGIEFDGIIATQAETIEKIPASSIPELLEANIGHEVELWITKRDKWEKFKILDVPKRRESPILTPHPENEIPLLPPRDRGEIVVLQGGESKEAIPLHWIESIRMFPGEQILMIERPKMENVVQVNVKDGKSGKSKKASMTYMAKGISWSPSYIVDISNDDKAVFSAKAIIINDLIPLKNTNLELIAGYPHIAFSEANSAFSLLPLNQILERIRSSGDRGRKMAFPMASNVAVLSQRSYAYADAAPAPNMPSTPVMGESSEDLYFYQVNDVTLKKGERGYYPLFAGEIPYEHIYTWDIPNYINEDTNYNNRNDQESPQQVVWHSLKLTNVLDSPWTTAPATTMKDGRIMGQDTVNFTPQKASTDLKITQAASITAEQNEYETKRQRAAAQFYGRNYDLVTVSGKLQVTNYKSESASIRITKKLSGEILDRDGEPEETKLAKGLRSVNPESQLIWIVDVKPAKDNAIELNYTYQVYVRG